MPSGLFDRDVERRLRLLEDAAAAVVAAQYMPSQIGGRGVLLTDAAQTFTTAVAANITWDTEISDPDGWTSGASATLTVPAGKGGRYIICYTGKWSGDPGTLGVVVLQVNTVNVVEKSSTRTGSYAFSEDITIALTLVPGDQIILFAIQNSGSDKDLVSRLEIM